jgi:hypothetical protein
VQNHLEGDAKLSLGIPEPETAIDLDVAALFVRKILCESIENHRTGVEPPGCKDGLRFNGVGAINASNAAF